MLFFCNIRTAIVITMIISINIFFYILINIIIIIITLIVIIIIKRSLRSSLTVDTLCHNALCGDSPAFSLCVVVQPQAAPPPPAPPRCATEMSS